MIAKLYDRLQIKKLEVYCTEGIKRRGVIGLYSLIKIFFAELRNPNNFDSFEQNFAFAKTGDLVVG